MKKIISFLVLILSIASCSKKAVNTSTPTPTTPTATTGNAIIYLKQDCNVGNVTVTVNGLSKLIKAHSTYQPDCSDTNTFAVFNLPAGSYPVQASAGNLTWSGNVTVTNGACQTFQLTCDGVTPALIGQPGTPRFNMLISAGVEFDLHVLTPDGSEISPYNLTGQGGKFDLVSSCLGSDVNYNTTGLTQTINNIYFPTGTATHGMYKFWVQFTSQCTNATSGSYTIRVIDGLSTIQTYTGTLTTSNVKSQVYTYSY